MATKKEKEQSRRKFEALEMLTELANRTANGQMTFESFARSLDQAFKGMIKPVGITIVGCGFDVSIHCCAAEALALAEDEKESNRSTTRKPPKGRKTVGHA